VEPYYKFCVQRNSGNISLRIRSLRTVNKGNVQWKNRLYPSVRNIIFPVEYVINEIQSFAKIVKLAYVLYGFLLLHNYLLPLYFVVTSILFS